MSNESHFTGNQNIVIQNVTDSTIKIAIGDRTEEILLELTALRQLMAERNSQIIQIAGKIYNIERIDEANFGFVLGKKVFNETLTRQLIEAITPYSTDADKFLQRASNTPHWESKMNISDRAKEIIAYSFVGPIGIQLRKLVAIGKEDFTELKQRKYIEKCMHIAKHCLELVSFALISNLWDEQTQKPRNLSPMELEKLSCRLGDPFEPPVSELFQLFQVLYELYTNPEHSISLPIPELASPNFADQLNAGGDLYLACHQLQFLSDNCLDKEQYDLVDCFEAEKNLATFLSVFSFLSNYRMASIREIGYKQMRNRDPRYLHHYAALGIDSKANVDTEKVKFTALTVHTDAVLLYRGNNYHDYINLSPFVIDYNALIFEQGTKICFYAYRSSSDQSLNYVFLDDQSIVPLESQGLYQLNDDLMIKPDQRKALNLDIVIEQFKDANHCLLGNASAFDNV